MANFHLMHCVHPRAHGLLGYLEVIQTIGWALEQLGHQVKYELNHFDPQAINIVFGAQVLPMETLTELPDNTIVYHMEQLRNAAPAQVKPQLRHAAQHFEIWDYTDANATVWVALNAKRLQTVPIGYAPLLTRIARPPQQDIDVLLYGLSSQQRLQALHLLSQAGLSTVYLSGLYGQARDELIGRSKIILNVTLYVRSQIFEIVRASYLLANSKAVVAIRDPHVAIEPDIERAIRFTTMERVIEDCLELCEHDDLRARIETTALKLIQRRDIRPIINSALSKSSILGSPA
ncbi:MAG: hypothetical protein FWD67_03390 [Betaproteobacteria bacterium]|nr:hypothetical protein [Betaproteobacteria bacterium]